MTRQDLETRRLQAIPDIDAKKSASQLARELKVSRTTIYRWRRLRAQGSNLARHKPPGRPMRMTVADAKLAILLFEAGPRLAIGTESNEWTQKSFAKAMSIRLGIEYSQDHAGRIMHRLNLTSLRKKRSAA